MNVQKNNFTVLVLVSYFLIFTKKSRLQSRSEPAISSYLV